jgi:hypothetical protein
MSGGPILFSQDDQDIFVGIFVEFLEETHMAWGIPVEKILELCPELKPQLPDDIDRYVKAVLQFCQEIPTVGTKAIFLDEIYVRQNLVHGKSETLQTGSESIRVQDAILTFQKMIVFGTAGLGKSTLLRYLTDCYVKEGINGKPVLPILISAKGLAEKEASFDRALREQIETELSIRLPNELPIGFLQEWQRKTGCVWLINLDGIDEIRDPFQKKRFIDNLAEYPWPQDAIIVITSRPDPTLEFPSTFQILELMPFGKKQTEEFLDRWFEGRIGKKQELKKKLKTDLRTLNETPLLLTVLSHVFESLGALPSNQVDMYDYFINLLLDIRIPAEVDFTGENWALRQTLQLLNQQFPGMGERIYSRRKELMEHVALGYYEHRNIYKIVRETLELSTTGEAQKVLQIFSSQRHGLLVKRSQYEFVHSTFRDFLAARKLVNNFQSNSLQIWKWIDEKWDDSGIRGLAIYALAILKKQGKDIKSIISKKTQNLEGLLFLSEYISVTGEVDQFGNRVLNLLAKKVRTTSRFDYLLGESAIEGIKYLSHYPATVDVLRLIIDDYRVDEFVREEALRILSSIVDASDIAKYLRHKSNWIARESVRILCEMSEFDRLFVLSQDKTLPSGAILEILDAFIKLEQWGRVIDAIPKHGKNDAWVEFITEGLVQRDVTSFREEFMLWVSQSAETSSDTKASVLSRLFADFLKSADTVNLGFVMNLLKATQQENACVELFRMFSRRENTHEFALLSISLIYDIDFGNKIIRQMITDQLMSVDLLEYVSKCNLLNDFLEYFQRLRLDSGYLAASDTYDLANLLLSKDSGFSLWGRSHIRRNLFNKKYWARFVPVIEIDQSVKFEQTSDDTILFGCNPQVDAPLYCMIIPADVKITIINLLQDQGNSKLKSLLKAFAASLALFIIKSDMGPLQFKIDEEYEKHSREIKTYLMNFLPKQPYIDKDTIQFRLRISHSSRPYSIAQAVRQGVYPINSTVSKSEMIDLIK